MALTHAQRTSMFNTLAEVMGQADAETLMQHLPPSGWDNVATKDDLRAGFAETNAAIATGLAQAAVERAEIKAQAAVERAEIKAQAAVERAEIVKVIAAGLAQAATERAEIVKVIAAGLAQAATERAEIVKVIAAGLAQAATERAEIIRRQAWHLYIVVSTIVVASVSIWIALLTQPGAGA